MCFKLKFNNPKLWFPVFFMIFWIHFYFAMLVVNHPDAPKYGFVIRSDGSILLGDKDTYTLESVEYWFNKWQVMRANGVFDPKPEDEGASSSQAPFQPALTNQAEKNEDQIKDKDTSPAKKDATEPKPKKSKKKGRNHKKK